MRKLDDKNIIEVGKQYNINPAILKAVALKEAAGAGFYPLYIKNVKHPYGEELVVRFEGHHFRKYTKGIYDKAFPYLSYANWKLGYKYSRGVNEFGRFLEAFKLNKEAAWLSSSWGMFQIMGFNYKACGYDSAKEMIIAFYSGEVEQLKAFLNYCEFFKILNFLRNEEFAKFARVYNGANFKVNKYDTELKRLTELWKNKL